MNTQQLESFIQVADNLNFARAAEALNITQSAVSRQIHSLEDELGTRLLHRSTRTVTLTPDGIDFWETAKSVIGKLQTATAKIRHNEQANFRTISIGCCNEADLDLLCGVLKIFRQQMPDIHPFIRVIPHRSILNLFYQDEIDLLFGIKEDIPIRAGIIYRELAKVPLCCVLPASHPLSQRDKINIEELFSEKVVVCNSYAIPLRVGELQNQIAQHLLSNDVYICDNMYVMLSLVQAGYGCSVLPKFGFPSPDIKYIPLNNIEPVSYGIFYKKEAYPSLKTFISIVKNMRLEYD